MCFQAEPSLLKGPGQWGSLPFLSPLLIDRILQQEFNLWASVKRNVSESRGAVRVGPIEETTFKQPQQFKDTSEAGDGWTEGV